MLDSNCRAYANNYAMDYVVIYIGHKDVIDTMAQSMRQTLIQRDKQRHQGINH